MLAAGFTDLATLKSRILPAGAVDITDWDDALQSLGKGVANAMNQACNRELQRGVSVIYECTAATLIAVVRRYPVEAIGSVQIRAYDGTLTTHTAGYQLAAPAGILQFASMPGDGTERLRITHTGGYWLDDGDDMPETATPMPDDLLEAFFIQAQVWAEARNLFGTASLQGEVEKKPADRSSAMRLAPEVAAILAPYRRFANE